MPLTKKQQQILDAIVFLIRRGEIPTVREVGSLAGLRSSATVSKHLKALAADGWITISGKSRGIRLADPALLESLTEQGAEATEGGALQTHFPQCLAVQFPERQSERLASGRLASESGSPGESVKSRSGRADERISIAGIPIVGAIAAGVPIDPREALFATGQDLCDDDELTVDARPALALDPGLFAPGSSSSGSAGGSPRLRSGELVALLVEGSSMIDAGIFHGDYVIVRRQAEVENGEIAAVLINGEGTLKRFFRSSEDLPPRGGHARGEHKKDGRAAEAKRSGGGGERHLSAKSASSAEVDALFDDTQDGTQDGTHDPFEFAEAEAASRTGGARAERRVELRAENPQFAPIVLSECESDQVFVFGKYVGLVRGDLRVL